MTKRLNINKEVYQNIRFSGERLDGNAILDFGCGDCKRLNHWLRKKGGKNKIGIDVDIHRIKEAKKRIKNGTEFLVCDGKYLPFKDCCFLLIHMDGVLHHITNISHGLSEIQRTLSGTLLVVESIDNYIPFRISRRIIRQYRGKKITFYFNSSQIIKKISKDFQIIKVNYKFSTLISNFISYSGIQNSFIYNRYFPLFEKIDYCLTIIFKKLNIIKYCSTHIEIHAFSKF